MKLSIAQITFVALFMVLCGSDSFAEPLPREMLITEIPVLSGWDKTIGGTYTTIRFGETEPQAVTGVEELPITRDEAHPENNKSYFILRSQFGVIQFIASIGHVPTVGEFIDHFHRNGQADYVLEKQYMETKIPFVVHPY